MLAASSMIGQGISSRSSHSWAAGRTTFSAKSWTHFWTCCTSSESSRENSVIGYLARQHRTRDRCLPISLLTATVTFKAELVKMAVLRFGRPACWPGGRGRARAGPGRRPCPPRPRGTGAGMPTCWNSTPASGGPDDPGRARSPTAAHRGPGLAAAGGPGWPPAWRSSGSRSPARARARRGRGRARASWGEREQHQAGDVEGEGDAQQPQLADAMRRPARSARPARSRARCR